MLLLYTDIMVDLIREDPVLECATNINTVEAIWRKLQSIDHGLLAEARSAQDALRTRQIVNQVLFREST